MRIKPSAAIRRNYNEISKACRDSGEPIFLTKNGEGDLVVMDIETYTRREAMLKLRENLVAAEEERLAGKKGVSPEELDAMMKKAIAEAANAR
jgi:prevent-host-death family protein